MVGEGEYKLIQVGHLSWSDHYEELFIVDFPVLVFVGHREHVKNLLTNVFSFFSSLLANIFKGIFSNEAENISDNCLFFYTFAFLGLEILHLKMHKFMPKVASRQNSIN